jgi:hypothetical protein
MTPTVASTLSDAQLRELLDLMGDVDRVELKTTVPESAHFEAAKALGIDPLDGRLRQVYFFDTPDLELNSGGLVLRARRIQGGRGDSVVKLRPVVPRELPESLRKGPGFTVELDAMPGAFVCSGTLKRKAGNAEVHEVVSGAGGIEELFSAGQRSLVEAQTRPGVFGDLIVLGPILVVKAGFAPDGLDRRMVAELWLYPDGSRLLELSTKCDPRDAFHAAAEARAFLSGRGFDLSGEQETKTRKALTFFAGRP